MSLPDVVSREQWLEARRLLLAQEKELTRRHDELNATRRRLPMVRVGQEYVFEGPAGKVTLDELFGDKRQLIVQHVMFGPDWDSPARAARPPSRSSIRACSGTSPPGTPRSCWPPAPRTRKSRRRRRSAAGPCPWYSADGSDFNYDYQVSLDEARGQTDYNYRSEPSLLGGDRSAEMPGYSASCATATRSSTPIRPSPGGPSTSGTPIPTST